METPKITVNEALIIAMVIRFFKRLIGDFNLTNNIKS